MNNKTTTGIPILNVNEWVTQLESTGHKPAFCQSFDSILTTFTLYKSQNFILSFRFSLFLTSIVSCC